MEYCSIYVKCIFISLEKEVAKLPVKGAWNFIQDSLWIYSPRHIIIVSTLLCSRVYSTKILRLLIFQEGSFQVVYNFNFPKFAMTGSTSQGPFKIEWIACDITTADIWFILKEFSGDNLTSTVETKKQSAILKGKPQLPIYLVLNSSKI